MTFFELTIQDQPVDRDNHAGDSVWYLRDWQRTGDVQFWPIPEARVAEQKVGTTLTMDSVFVVTRKSLSC